MYKLANDDELKDIRLSLEDWMSDGFIYSRFNSVLSITRLAVFEYIANQRGLTIYPDRANVD